MSNLHCSPPERRLVARFLGSSGRTTRRGTAATVRLQSFAIGLLVAAGLGAQVVDNPHLAVPRFQGQSTDEFLYFDQKDGRGRIADRLREPADIRVRGLDTNLFRTYGRTSGQPTFGDLHLIPIYGSAGTVRAALFVEGSTGYTAYIDDLGRGGDLGELKPLIGRAFGPIRAADGNFALMPRQDRRGRTQGAYLYHAGTGDGLYIDDITELRLDPPVSRTTTLPQATGWVSTAPILAGGTTRGYLVIDNAAGTVHFLDIAAGSPERLVQRQTDLDLNEAFAADEYNPCPTRFVPVSLQNADDTTERILLIDVSTGKMAYLEGLSVNSPTLRFFSQNLYQVLRPGIEATTRVLTAVPNQTSAGRTVGVWLIDSRSGSLLYLANIDDPGSLRVSNVRVNR